MFHARLLCSAMAMFGGVIWAAAALAQDPAPYPNNSAFADRGPIAEDWYRTCLAVKNTAPAASDLPQADIAKTAANCDAATLYYDAQGKPSTTPQDWRPVAACAFKTQNPAVLMMLYANGLGVPRNLDLAIKYACSMDAAQMETAGRVEHLSRMKTAPGATEVFDQCDDITSGMMMGYCSGLAQAESERDRAHSLDALTHAWMPPERKSFDKMKALFDKFVESHAGEEQDMSGTARGAIAIGEEENKQTAFLKNLTAFEKGEFPKFTSAQFQQKDAALNAVYKKVMALPEQDGHLGIITVTKAGVRQTQREWLKYRDAWVAFAAIRYPAVPADAWKTMLTDERIADLKDVLSQAQ